MRRSTRHLVLAITQMVVCIAALTGFINLATEPPSFDLSEVTKATLIMAMSLFIAFVTGAFSINNAVAHETSRREERLAEIRLESAARELQFQREREERDRRIAAMVRQATERSYTSSMSYRYQVDDEYLRDDDHLCVDGRCTGQRRKAKAAGKQSIWDEE